MIRFEGLGLDNVLLVNGYEVEREGGHEFIVVRHLDKLQQTVALALAKAARPLQGQEFRFLREQLHLSQADMGRKIGRDHHTVARWELAIREPVPQFVTAAVRQLYLESVGESPRFTDVVAALEKAARQAVQATGFWLNEETDGVWKGEEARLPEDA